MLRIPKNDMQGWMQYGGTFDLFLFDEGLHHFHFYSKSIFAPFNTNSSIFNMNWQGADNTEMLWKTCHIYSMQTQNWHVAQKYAIDKKSAIFTQFLWDLVKMTILRVSPFDQVSKKLGKNCGFFNNSIFLGHMSILGPHTV